MHYMMESDAEGKRIREKTELSTTVEHLTLAGLKRGMRSIDVGCASGEVLREIARFTYPGKATGFDISKERINESKQIDKGLGFTNIDYVQGSVYETGIPENTYDFVWTRFLFEYLKEPLRALEELKRIAKPGGKIVVADLDGNCVFHYPFENNFMMGVNRLISILNDKAGFDPHVGGKLHNYFYKVGFKEIKVNILPYHCICGTPDQKTFLLWQEKIRILKSNFKKFEEPLYEENKHVFDEFLEFLKRPDTTTYSVIFIVQALKI